jgi:hypothetical protein
MKHSRFKYFSRLENADTFLDGKVFCQTAAFFRDYENAQAQQIIGDEYEGTRLYRLPDGLQINNSTRNQTLTLNVGMECATRAHEICGVIDRHWPGDTDPALLEAKGQVVGRGRFGLSLLP